MTMRSGKNARRVFYAVKDDPRRQSSSGGTYKFARKFARKRLNKIDRQLAKNAIREEGHG